PVPSPASGGPERCRVRQLAPAAGATGGEAERPPPALAALSVGSAHQPWSGLCRAFDAFARVHGERGASIRVSVQRLSTGRPRDRSRLWQAECQGGRNEGAVLWLPNQNAQHLERTL